MTSLEDTSNIGLTDADAATTDAPSSRRTWLRLGALGAMLLGLYVVGAMTGLTDGLTPERLRDWIQAAGVGGAALFVGVFALGLLMQVPGLLFVAAGVAVYGPWLGTVVSLLGALMAVSVSFWVVRLVGGQALAAPKRPLIARIMARLEAHPVCTVALLRITTILSPPVNYALALSKLRYRDYLVGSALGLMVSLTAASALMGTFF